ncbi:MAG: FecR family protein [Saprospiraceae bacterium]|nr:FecR family protein [Saprospiraceae bacterium]
MDIDKIILKVLNKKASQEEYKALEDWRNESKDNLKYLETLNIQHAGFERYRHFDKQSAWEQINARISQPINLISYLIGAAVIIAILFFAINFMDKKEQYPKVYESNDQIASIALIDESKIELNRQAQLTQLSDFTTERKVSLTGEAFFDISHNPDKPFVVELSPKEYIKVLGTSFNLINTDDEFELTVISGQVELRTLNRSIIMNKGDKMVLVQGAYVKLQNNDVNLLSWKDRKLVFKGAHITEVLKNLEDYFDLEINLSNDVSTEMCILQSSYNNPQLDTILEEMGKIFKMDYVLDNNKLDIIGLNCQ